MSGRTETEKGALRQLDHAVREAAERLCKGCEWDLPVEINGELVHVDGSELDECHASDLWRALYRMNGVLERTP